MALRAPMRAKAAGSSVIGRVLSMTGLTLPWPYHCTSVPIMAAFAWGSRLAKSPQNTPTSEAPLSSGRFSGSAGMGPEAKPTTR